MTRVRVCSAAEMEFTDALRWYANRSPHVALTFDSEFDEVLAKIAESPDRFPNFDVRHRIRAHAAVPVSGHLSQDG